MKPWSAFAMHYPYVDRVMVIADNLAIRGWYDSLVEFLITNLLTHAR
jgi:hypothetical protein